MNKATKLLFLVLIFGVTSLFSQKSAIYTNDLEEFQRAVNLYNNNQYQSAQILFDKVKALNTNNEVQADCAYYAANCAIHLNQANADEMMERFVSDYPTSSKQNQAYIEVSSIKLF
jgi:hypothetical protein